MMSNVPMLIGIAGGLLLALSAWLAASYSTALSKQRQPRYRFLIPLTWPIGLAMLVWYVLRAVGAI